MQKLKIVVNSLIANENAQFTLMNVQNQLLLCLCLILHTQPDWSIVHVINIICVTEVNVRVINL